MEFHAVTAEVAGRDGPYRGHAGMELYFADVEQIWEEINLTPTDFEEVGDVILVTGQGLGAGQRPRRGLLDRLAVPGARGPARVGARVRVRRRGRRRRPRTDLQVLYNC